MVITMVALMIMVSSAAVVVIFAVPMALVHLPPFAVMVVVRMTPVSPFVWRTVPAPPHPPVMLTDWFPVSIHPDKVWSWRRSILLIADGWWWSSDVHRYLCRTGGHNSSCEQYAVNPIQSHFLSPPHRKRAVSVFSIRAGVLFSIHQSQQSYRSHWPKSFREMLQAGSDSHAGFLLFCMPQEDHFRLLIMLSNCSNNAFVASWSWPTLPAWKSISPFQVFTDRLAKLIGDSNSSAANSDNTLVGSCSVSLHAKYCCAAHATVLTRLKASRKSTRTRGSKSPASKTSWNCCSSTYDLLKGWESEPWSDSDVTLTFSK